MQRLSDDEGATAVLVAVMLFVLLGFGALVLDVGNLYWERRTLQNGADAAVLAAARDLAAGDAGAARATAAQYADANNARGAFLEEFTQPTANSLRVTTRTGAIPAPGELDSLLIGVLGIDTYFARASAEAAWGGVGSGTTIPIALCEHAWEHFTNDGATLPSGPPAHILRVGVPPGHEDEDVDCSNPGAGDPPPGGFGFLDANGECTAVVNVNGWMDGSTGNNPDVTGSSPCSTDDFYEMLYDVVNDGGSVLIPIFDEYTGSGSSGSYHIIGFGGFRLEGYSINAGPAPTNTTHGRTYNWSGSCPGSASCLLGYFTEFVSLDGDLAAGGGDEYGATVIRLTR